MFHKKENEFLLHLTNKCCEDCDKHGGKSSKKLHFIHYGLGVFMLANIVDNKTITGYDAENKKYYQIRTSEEAKSFLEIASQYTKKSKQHPILTCGLYKVLFEIELHKKQDIVIYYDNKPVVLCPFKMPMKNYSQNSGNVVDGLQGECVNILGYTIEKLENKCLISPLYILMNKYPYYTAAGDLKRVENPYEPKRAMTHIERFQHMINSAKRVNKKIAFKNINFGVLLMNSDSRIAKIKKDSNADGLLTIHNEQPEFGINQWIKKIKSHIKKIEASTQNPPQKLLCFMKG